MESKRREQYQRHVRHLEEPIRQIVPALWGLPFVRDTAFSCSGHILRERGLLYPHRAMLEISFIPDAELSTELRGVRDAFRADLASIRAGSGSLELGFSDAHSYESDTLPYSRVLEPNVTQYFNAHLPTNLEHSPETVHVVEEALTALWEETASVLRRYNSEAAIDPIAGKNFRTVINWAHWRSVFDGPSTTFGGIF